MNDGEKVYLENAKLYPTYDSKESDKTVNGEYFIYNSKTKNDRIRITDDINKVNLPCSMTGWVDISDIKQ